RRMPRTLAHAEGDRDSALTLCLGPQLHRDRGEHAGRQQVLARSLYLACTIVLAAVHEQPSAHVILVDLLQAADADLSDLHARTGDDMEADVQHSIRRI